MPPRVNSRYQFSVGLTDANGRLFLSDPEPYRFQSFTDNRQHVVAEGDTLQGLSARFFDGDPSFWWVIAHFQPDPIIDPTIALEPGRAIVIPSRRILVQEILSPRRAQS